MNACRPLAVLLLALPVAALAQRTSGIHDTGVVQLEVFDNGKLGAFADGTGGTSGTGFVFGGKNGLFEGAFVVGQSSDRVSGDVYDFPDVEWRTVSPITPVTPPLGYDEAYVAVYDDSSASNPLGLRVTQRSYARADDPRILVDFEVENVSDGSLQGLYLGVFADWNVSPSAIEHDLCAFDEGTALLYCWDITGGNPGYYGIAAFEDNCHPNPYPLSGIHYDVLPGDAALFEALTTVQPAPTQPSDVRVLLGGGPYDLGTGERQTVTVAFVGGADAAEVIENARPDICPATEPSAEDVGIGLHAASPNPARGATTLSFTLARPQPVRLAVLDALGREVAVLVEGERSAGEHRVRWVAAGLAPGVYLVRLAAGGATASRTVTLLR